jgi:hypothetical protein
MAGDDRRKKSSPSSPGQACLGATLVSALELRLDEESGFCQVCVQSFRGREMAVLVEGEPPPFGQAVVLRNPVVAGEENHVSAEVVGLERQGEATSVVLSLAVDAGEALDRLVTAGARGASRRHRPSGPPLFEMSLEDSGEYSGEYPPPPRASYESSRAGTGPSIRDSRAGDRIGETSGELNWGWVARAEASPPPLASPPPVSPPVSPASVSVTAANAEEDLEEDKPPTDWSAPPSPLDDWSDDTLEDWSGETPHLDETSAGFLSSETGGSLRLPPPITVVQPKNPGEAGRYSSLPVPDQLSVGTDASPEEESEEPPTTKSSPLMPSPRPTPGSAGSYSLITSRRRQRSSPSPKSSGKSNPRRRAKPSPSAKGDSSDGGS